MKRRMLVWTLRSAIFGMGILLTNSALAEESPPRPLAIMSLEEQQILTFQMQSALDEALAGKRFFEDDPMPVTAKVSLSVAANEVIIDLDERLGPRAYTSECEDLNRHISNVLWPFMETIKGPRGTTTLYGGRDPEWWPENRDPQSTSTSRRKRSVNDVPLLVVSPGHGVYYHGKFKDWRAQRDPANGVLEDDLTTVLAGHLTYAAQRDGVRVDNMRPESQPLLHSPSKEPWWRLAARYQLAQKHPDLTQIWQSEPHSSAALQERNEDIRSRPLYANYVNADALIHVHTNADETGAANGFRVYIAKNRPEDRLLASKILCSARELIRTDDRFAPFSVASEPNDEGNHGENRLAKVPSAIVEVGFHTNSQDAAFLKDRTFQALAMRGVAKGYRLYRNKLPCDDFSINPVDDVTGRVGVDVHLPFSFKGNPVYPIRIWTKDAGCTAARGCGGTDKVLSGPSDLEKFKVRYLCHREDVDRSPISLNVTARDFDGVRARPATYKIACTR